MARFPGVFSILVSPYRPTGQGSLMEFRFAGMILKFRDLLGVRLLQRCACKCNDAGGPGMAASCDLCRSLPKANGMREKYVQGVPKMQEEQVKLEHTRSTSICTLGNAEIFTF